MEFIKKPFVYFLISLLIVCHTGKAQLRRKCKAADVVIVMDTSSSIWFRDFKKQLVFVDEVVSQLNIGPEQEDTRIGIITFADGVWLKFNLHDHMDVESLQDAIHRIKHRAGTWTDTGAGIKYMRENMFKSARGGRGGVVDVGIVITDGQSQNFNKTLAEAAKARADGIEMYAIGVGPHIKYSELQGIASDPDNQYVYTVEDYDNLIHKKDFFAQQHCKLTTTPVPVTTPTTTTTPIPPPPPTQAPIYFPPVIHRSRTVINRTVIRRTNFTRFNSRDDRNTHRRTQVVVHRRNNTFDNLGFVRSGILQECTGKPADIYFLLDASASIGDHNFEVQKQFVKNLVSRFDISSDNTRVGIVTFSNSYDLNVPLGIANTQFELPRAIDRIPYTYGMTNTADAIRYVRMFGFYDDRRNAAKIAIVLTDGLSRQPTVTKQEAALAKEQGINLFAIGIGEAVNSQELRDIGNSPSDRYVFHVSNYGALDSIKDILATRTCSVSPIEKICSSRDVSDIMFLYDALALGADKTSVITKFITSAIANFDTRTGNIRVGRMLYDCLDDAYQSLISPSDAEAWRHQVLPGILELLKQLRHRGFSSSRWERPEAKSTAVLFVDGRLHNLFDVQRHMDLMSNVQFITIIVGGNDGNITLRTTGNNIVLTVPSYEDLYSFKDTFLSYLCPNLQ